MWKEYPKSKQLFEESCKYFAGGVGAQVRSLSEPHPIFITHGKGSKIYDVDGNDYIDYLLAYGPLILGHSPAAVVSAVREQIERGSLFGCPHELQIKLSRLLVETVPSYEMVRYNNTGSEAVQAALRLARAFTGRFKVIKFEGHYHGWYDNIFVSFHPGEGDDFGTPDEPKTVLHKCTLGQPPSVLEDVIALPWNDLAIVEKTLQKERGRVAAVITEPIMSNCGVIMPRPGYLEGLRKLTRKYDALLIFDEVITGQRVALGGAQELFGVLPDITISSKALGGGYPILSFGGRREIMEYLALKKTVHAGTFNANPLSVAAAYATLSELAKDEGAIYKRLTGMGRHLMKEIGRLAGKYDIAVRIEGPGPFFCVSFKRGEIYDMRSAFRGETTTYTTFRRLLLDRGVHIFPSEKGLWYLSAAHNEEDIEKTLAVVDDVFRVMKQ